MAGEPFEEEIAGIESLKKGNIVCTQVQNRFSLLKNIHLTYIVSIITSPQQPEG